MIYFVWNISILASTSTQIVPLKFSLIHAKNQLDKMTLNYSVDIFDDFSWEYSPCIVSHDALRS